MYTCQWCARVYYDDLFGCTSDDCMRFDEIQDYWAEFFQTLAQWAAYQAIDWGY